LGRKCRHDEHNLTRPTQQPLPVAIWPTKGAKSNSSTAQMANASGHSGPGRRAAQKKSYFPPAIDSVISRVVIKIQIQFIVVQNQVIHYFIAASSSQCSSCDHTLSEKMAFVRG